MTDPQERYGFRVGDRVTPVGEHDHPEDPVGTVSTFLDGGIFVVFPLVGAEMWAASDLRRVEH